MAVAWQPPKRCPRNDTLQYPSWFGEGFFIVTFEIKSTLSRSIIPWDFVFEMCDVLYEPHVRSYTGLSVLDNSDTCFREQTATIRSHKSSADFPSNLNPASKKMISDSVELCDTEVCFLHIQLVGTNVWFAKMHKSPPDVYSESSRSPAKSESGDNPNLHCCDAFPAWQHYLHFHVWWMYFSGGHDETIHKLWSIWL